MKTFLTILLITFFVTPVFAQEGELDGKGLGCTSIEDESGPNYYLFFKGNVLAPSVSDKTPLMIRYSTLGEYEADIKNIWWTGLLDYQLDRKTLKLTLGTSLVSDCQVMTHEEIVAILQKQIEALKEEMKDNKI